MWHLISLSVCLGTRSTALRQKVYALTVPMWQNGLARFALCQVSQSPEPLSTLAWLFFINQRLAPRSHAPVKYVKYC